MGEWNARIVSKKLGESESFRIEIIDLLNEGWEIKGYSFEAKTHRALLVKKGKQGE